MVVPTMTNQPCNTDGSHPAWSERPDAQEFMSLVKAVAQGDTSGLDLSAAEHAACRGLFSPEDTLHMGRAPGRLDVMGGIADYSGSLVLQLPLAQGTFAAAQAPRAPAAGAATRPLLRIVSLQEDCEGGRDAHPARSTVFEADLVQLTVSSYEDAKCQLRSDPATAWAAYVAGGAVVLARELGVDWARACPGGLRLLLQSSVPEGKGVSSSAALEVATLSALLQLLKKSEERDLCPDLAALAPSDVALLAQRVENDVVGAPCGVMDQMASCVGREDSLLVLQCRPARLLPGASLGSHLSTWGLDSGVAHCVGGADYGAVRTAAFMGRAIIRRRMQELRLEGEQAGPAAGGFQDANAWWEALSLGDRPAKRDDASSSQTLEYLTQLSPSEFEARWESALPERMTGAEFIDEFGSHDDPATTIDRDAVYHVRTCTAHPIYENFRVHCFKELLETAQQPAPHAWRLLGELMFQSHASYGRCGLGSPGTDRLVELVREAAALERDGPVLLGAKITGGGSG
ncbi:hypothetical protein H632_c1365p1, partial [Helicosporidium sp. ATCC 50920]